MDKGKKSYQAWSLHSVVRNSLMKPMALCGLMVMSSLPLPSAADEVFIAEQKLLSGLQSIQALSMDSALEQFSDLSDSYPKYKLVQLVKADLLALKAGQKSLLESVHRQHPKSVSKLQEEARVRWQFAQSAFQANPGFDKYVLKTAQQSNLILVSLPESRLYLYERDKTGQLNRVADYYVTMGRKGSGKQKEGDLRTPVGVYHIIDLLPDSQLPDLYGVGALPLNYPNQWDKQHGKTGSGIWLHGTPSDTYSRAPRASRGCVVLNNKAMQKLLADYRLPFATPVLIVDDVAQVFEFSNDKEHVLSEVKTWLKENQVSADWNNVSVFRYPNEENLFYVTFPADVKNELVHQYWQRDYDGGWRMVVHSQEPMFPKKRA